MGFFEKGDLVKHSDMMERVKALKEDIWLKFGETEVIDKYFPEEDDDG